MKAANIMGMNGVTKKAGQSEVVLAANQKIKERDYWLNKLSGNLEKSYFPADFAKSIKSANQEKETFSCPFPAGLSSKLLKASSGSDLKLHVLLSAALVLLLNKYTGNEDIVIAAPIYRQRREADFLNTVLILRCFIKEDMTSRELLMQMKQTIAEAVENRNYPVILLAEQLNKPYPPGNNFPLFDTALLIENIHDKSCFQPLKHNMTFSFSRDGESFESRVEYNPLVYLDSTVERIFRHFIRLLGEVLDNLELRLSQIDILSTDEKTQLLVDFNNTEAPYPRDKTIHRLFEDQVERSGDKIAVIGSMLNAVEIGLDGGPAPASSTGETDVHHLTYRELDKKAGQLAVILREKGVRPGVIVGVMAKRSIEMMMGILAILKAGGAYLPIEPGFPKDRITYILEDSVTRLLLTQQTMGKRYVGLCELLELDDPALYGFERGYVDNLVLSTDLAYVTYTSGSTGKPKGVMIKHRSVVNFIKGITDIIPFRESDAILSLTTVSFDIFGLETILPLTKGARVVVGSDEEQLDPLSTAAAMVRENTTVFQATPSRLTLLISNHEASKALGILNSLLVGGESFPAMLLDEVRRLTSGKIYNVYGPTETTIWSTIKDVSGDRWLNIGKPLANQRVYILSKSGLVQPIGVVGELCISGDGVARGYLNRPELTAEKFSRGVPTYRTGDLARWLPDGNIEFLGRLDHQVKIRGYRIELGEIESQLLKHNQVNEAVVIAGKDEKGDKYLCAYIVPDGTHEQGAFAELKDYLSRSLPGYMIPSHFMQIESIPLTPNGKIDRKALPAPEIEIGGEYVAPRGSIEEKMVEIWADVLNLNGMQTRIGITSNFFELGGHSLRAVVLISKMHKEFNVIVPLAEVFRTPHIEGLSRYLTGADEDRYKAIEPAEKKEYYIVSSGQKRMYILWQTESNRSLYNMPASFPLEEKPDLEAFERAFTKLIERHESLRTSFHMIDDQPVQKVHDTGDVEFKIEYYEVSPAQSANDSNTGIRYQESIIRNHFNRPFDLSKAPLLKVGLIKTSDEKYILAVVMHHIISDGISHNILLKDFRAAYEGEVLPPLRIQYKDFSEWQYGEKEKENIKQQEIYWLEEFEGEIPVFNMPIDYNRPTVLKYEGGAISFEIPGDNTRMLKSIALEHGVSTFMELLTIYNIFLSKVCNQHDIIIGTPVAGRRHVDLESVMGMFVNTLALRNRLEGEKTFKELLLEVKERTLNAFENQEYQFEDLVAKLMSFREAGHHPLTDAFFEFQYIQTQEGNDVRLETGSSRNMIVKADLVLRGLEIGEKLFLKFEYCAELFKEKTIERFIGYFKDILSSVVENQHIKLKDISIAYDLSVAKTVDDYGDFGF